MERFNPNSVEVQPQNPETFFRKNSQLLKTERFYWNKITSGIIEIHNKTEMIKTIKTDSFFGHRCQKIRLQRRNFLIISLTVALRNFLHDSFISYLFFISFDAKVPWDFSLCSPFHYKFNDLFSISDVNDTSRDEVYFVYSMIYGHWIINKHCSNNILI